MSFLKTHTGNPELAERFPEVHPPLDAQSALLEANRCLYCFDAPCSAACPTHIDVPRFIKKISQGNLHGSAVTILDANILGASCSRVCPVDVLCEGACVYHRYNKHPIQIGLVATACHGCVFSKWRGAAKNRRAGSPSARRVRGLRSGFAGLRGGTSLARLPGESI